MIDQVLTTLRRTALHALATQHGLEHAPDWLSRALRKHRLSAAVGFLRKATQAGRVHRWWLKRFG